MPIYLTREEEATPVPLQGTSGLLVTPIGAGLVSLHTPNFNGPSFSLTLDRSALPQLKQVVQLLEQKTS